MSDLARNSDTPAGGFEKIPPYNLEAEQSVLAAAMMSPAACEGVVGMLLAEDFYRPAHGRIFRAVSSLMTEGARVDHLTVADRLTAMSALESSGGKPYLIDITGVMPSASGWKRYAEIVKRTSTKRQLLDAGTRIVALAYEDADEDALAKADTILGRVRDGHNIEHPTIGSVIDRVALASVEKSEYITLPEIDLRLRPGEVCYVGARPKIGKTSLMSQWAHELATRHLRSVSYNYEMSNEEMATRYIAAVGGVPRKNLDDGIGQTGVQHITKFTAGDWREFMLTVDTMPPISQLCADIRRQARRGARIVFIDYLHLVVDGSDYQEVTRASRQFKLAAKAAGIPLVIISQLSRLEPGVRPKSTDLRQSGAIEQDADVVVLMHSFEYPEKLEADDKQRQQYVNEGFIMSAHDPRKLGYLQVALHRSGPTYTRPAFYSGDGYRWTAMDKTADGKPAY